MSANLELVADVACQTAENPLWHPMEQLLYWIDIPTGRIFRYDPALGEHEQCYSGETIGGFTIQIDGSLLLFMARGSVRVWRNGETETLIDELPDERTTRFNDVIADPAGRVFCGTMSTKERAARLYRLDTDGTITRVLDGIGQSNGMGFTPDDCGFYHTDTTNRAIYRFDYDKTSGAITNRRIFAEVPDREGIPDGLTVDAEGYIWSARWDGSCLVRYAADGSEERRIQFPVNNVTSVTFGGPDYCDIYVTTASGALFRLRLDISGRPENLSRITAS